MTSDAETQTASKQSAEDDEKKLNEFYRSYVQNAFLVVRDHFPVKIRELEKLKKEFNWSLVRSIKSNTDWVHKFTGTYFDGDKSKDNKTSLDSKVHLPARCIASDSMKPALFDVYCGPKGAAMIETNQTVHQMILRLKPYAVELADHALQLIFALQLLEPKMQEGNNFGLEVQHKAIKGANEAYTYAQSFQESLSSFYSSRDGALQSVMSYPHIEDQQGILDETERSFVYVLCRGVDELYNTYLSLLDLVSKNILKLLLPRDDQASIKPQKPIAK